jgi:hypothetical protein
VTAGPDAAPPAGAPVRVDPSLVRPGRFWYWLGGALGVAGIAISVVLGIGLIGDIDSLTGELTRLNTPGRATLKLDAGAERTIYQQTRGVSGSIDTAPDAIVACAVAGPDGKPVDVEDTGGFTLKRGSERYESVLKFEVDRAGRYRVRCEDRGDRHRTIPLAIGETVGLFGFIGRIFATLGAFFGGIIVAAGTATVVAIMRSHNRQRLAREAQSSG